MSLVVVIALSLAAGNKCQCKIQNTSFLMQGSKLNHYFTEWITLHYIAVQEVSKMFKCSLHNFSDQIKIKLDLEKENSSAFSKLDFRLILLSFIYYPFYIFLHFYLLL